MDSVISQTLIIFTPRPGCVWFLVWIYIMISICGLPLVKVACASDEFWSRGAPRHAATSWHFHSHRGMNPKISAATQRRPSFALRAFIKTCREKWKVVNHKVTKTDPGPATVLRLGQERSRRPTSLGIQHETNEQTCGSVRGGNPAQELLPNVLD